MHTLCEQRGWHVCTVCRYVLSLPRSGPSSGVPDTATMCRTGYISVFLVALVTDRAFVLHQPDGVRAQWEDIYAEKHISWSAKQHLNFSAEQQRDNFGTLDLWCAACFANQILS